MMMLVESYTAGRWHGPSGPRSSLLNASTSERALALKRLATHLNGMRDAFYAITSWTGATKRDALIDVDGGIGVLFTYASKGRPELPNTTVLLDGPTERLGRGGQFVGQYIYTPSRGIALQINAFNFPVWGMLEKLARAFLAGVPTVVKPSLQTSYLAAAVVREMVDSAVLPAGSLQLVAGGSRRLLDLLTDQDTVAFTGSASTAATSCWASRRGPGRAGPGGGGEELDGIRSMLHYMQRTAVQGSPRSVSAVTGTWVTAAPRNLGAHPFRKSLAELRVGDAVEGGPRVVTLDDVNEFADLSGDQSYAHTHDEAASATTFFDSRVAHGYLVVALAAGLFVSPDPGPVLANYGLEHLRFVTPVYPGDALRVTLTAKSISPRADADDGEVAWDALVVNQREELVATYDVLTTVAKSWPREVGTVKPTL